MDTPTDHETPSPQELPAPQAAAAPDAAPEPDAASTPEATETTKREAPPETLALPLDGPQDPLAALLEESRTKRLAPAQEEEAAQLLRDRIKGGKAGLASAVDPLLAFPWIIGVNAVIGAWPDLSLPMRRWLLASLARHDTDAARRLRLSLARAIFKVDPSAGLKLAAAVASKMRDEETGAFSQRSRQIFYNVLIGKGKPWLLQFPIAELKAADANHLIRAAIACFQICPPLSQLSILRWINEAGRLKKLSEEDLAIAVKSVGRWNARFQRQLRHDIPELPEAIVAVLKPEKEPSKAPEAQPAAADASPKARATKTPERQRPAPEAPQTPQEAMEESNDAPERDEERSPSAESEPGHAEDDSDADRHDEDEGDDQGPTERHPGERPLSSRERKHQERLARQAERRAERDRKAEGRKAFDFKDSLRGLDQYIHTLRNELEAAKAQVRRLEEGPRKLRRPAPEGPAVDTDGIVRHNAQLEATIADLRTQLEDLAAHHEAIAESRNLHGEEPVAEGSREQLVALLAIKLQEPYETYEAMRLDPLDRVFRLDYRDLLGNIFDVLIEEGVALKKP